MHFTLQGCSQAWACELRDGDQLLLLLVLQARGGFDGRWLATEQLIWTWSSHAQHSILFYSSQKGARVSVYVALQPNSFYPTRVGRNACSRHHQHASVDSYNSRFFTLISRRLSPVRTYSPKIGTDLEATPLATLDVSTHLSISSSSNPTHLMCVASQTTHTPTAFSSFSFYFFCLHPGRLQHSDSR